MNVERQTITDISQLSQALAKIKITAWDVLLVGDGSGGGWELGGGWGCTLIEASTSKRITFYGGMSLSTINIAELMPYLHALSWYESNRQKRIAAGTLCRVAIVTDHEAIAKIGTALNRGMANLDSIANASYWAALRSFERRGFALKYTWIPRASLALNCLADAYAKECFRAMKTITKPTTPDGKPVSAYECNPKRDRPTIIDSIEAKQPPAPRQRKPVRDRACRNGVDE